jgi:hypothetical protein
MHESIDTLALTQYIAELNTTARQAGIEIELRTDFGHLIELCEGLPDKPVPNAMFNPMKADIGGHNGFWLKGSDSNGVLVYLEAVRIYDMNGTNLAREITSLRAFYANPDLAPNGERCDCAAPMAERITGMVCYHGEIWIRGSDPNLRGQALSGPLSRLLLGLVLARWSPDYVFGLAYDWTVKRGLSTSYGYWHAQPGATHWVQPHRDKPLDLWLLWLTRQDLIDLMRMPA